MNIYIMKKDKPIKSLDFLEYICKTKNIPFNKNDIYYNEHNKPYYKDFYFNTSHSKNYIILAISTKEVGIDIEEERSYHHNLSNNNYYCFIVGEEQINSIETIDYQYYLKRK